MDNRNPYYYRNPPPRGHDPYSGSRADYYDDNNSQRYDVRGYAPPARQQPQRGELSSGQVQSGSIPVCLMFFRCFTNDRACCIQEPGMMSCVQG